MSVNHRELFGEILAKAQANQPVGAEDANRPGAGILQAIFVAAKEFILTAGCEHLEESIALAKEFWTELAATIDIPRVPAFIEDKLKAFLWARIEAGVRKFAATACPTVPPAPGSRLFASSESLMGMARDHTLDLD